MGELISNPPLDNSSTATTTAPSGLVSWVRRLLASRSARILLAVVACMLVIVALIFVGRSLSFDLIRRTLIGARLEWLALAVALAGAGHIVRIARTCWLLRWETRPRTGIVAQSLLGSQIVNWLSPIRAGDIWRVLHLTQNGRNSLLWIASDTVLEKGADSIVLAVFGAVLLMLPLPAGISVPIAKLIISVFIFLMLFTAISALGSSRLRDRLLARLPRLPYIDRWLNTSLPEIKITRRPRHWLELISTSVLIWVSGLVVNVAVAKAFGIKIDLATHLLLLLTLQTTTVLAPVPGNIGVFPLIAMTVLSAVGIDRSLAAAYGSVLYVLAYGVLLIVAAVAFAPAIRWPRRAYAGHTTATIDGLTSSPGTIRMLGVQIDLIDAPGLIDVITRTALAQQRALIGYVNAHGMNLACAQPQLRRFFNDSTQRVFCDGFGVRWGAHLAGLPAPERFTPRDWIDGLAEACATNNLSMYLIGNEAGVVQSAADELVRQHPKLRIAGTHHGFFNKTPGSAENTNVIDEINKAAPDVLLVGFGMPVQEYWLDENWAHLHVPVGIAVGGLFGLLAGSLWRPPKWMTDNGLEWLGRLWVEPARLWRRYLIGNPLFLSRIIRERLGLLHIE